MEKPLGSVKAAVTCYRQRISEGQTSFQEVGINHFAFPDKIDYNCLYFYKALVKRRELHWAKRDTNLLAESRKNSELVTAEARSELFSAKKMAKDLKRRIAESNARMEKLRMGKREEEECNKVMRELEMVKREVSKLKMDMASVKEERSRAEKEMNASISKRESSVESLTKEIEEVNEEHVLVELARIEAIKEYEEIQTQTRDQAQIYASAIQASHKKTQNIIDEIEDAKQVEARLMATMSEITTLECELKENKEITPASLLESVLKELVATKKELEQVKEGSFQFMASMDVVRDELTHVMDQTARLRKEEKETEIFIQTLNSKLLKAKTKLEETSAAKVIISNLKLTLEQLQSEAETHEKEMSGSSEETALVKAEIQKSETEIDLSEERLQSALQDLKAVKSSEALALENLKSIIDKTVRNRGSASRPSSTITISKFEYEYLKGNAAGAKEIADKKVAAAQAWVEALKASEKEIQIKAELFRREMRELQVEEEHQTEVSKKRGENDFENWRQMMEFSSEKAMNKSVKRTPTRRGMARRSASPVVPRSTSFTVGRRRKVMPNLAKFFSGKPIESDLQPA